jgi:glycerol kinase
VPHRYIAAVDQGTTSTRCFLFDETGTPLATARADLPQHTPKPGWVEHDPEDIWRTTVAVLIDALSGTGLGPADLAGVGITNQRETTVLWDRDTGEPVGNAIVWQDTRTADRFRDATGLPLSTYFSGLKLRWMLDQDPDLHRRAHAGDLCFGTVDSWLIHRFTGQHLTDVTNASRTMLMNLRTLTWDDDILTALDLPRAALPDIRPSAADFGVALGDFAGMRISAALGDQHAALLGQRCLDPGDVKNTYGTGSFLVANTGPEPVRSAHGLLTTVAFQLPGRPADYALEGSISHTGALIQWLRDDLGLIGSAAETQALAAAVPDTGGAYIVPAFSGLFAPHWRPDARGVICGLTGYVRREHLVRAALEAACWQTRDVVEALRADTGAPIDRLHVDGGMTVNRLLLQLQADILGGDVIRPANPETTALGAAYAAGLTTGVWDLDTLRALHVPTDRWTPETDRENDYPRWQAAVRKTLE